MLRALILSLLIATSANAQTAGEAATADLASTAGALLLGAAEANPLGILLIPAKIAVIKHAESLPTGEREHALSAVSSMWLGAAANNLCIIAAIATGGAFSPACLVVGLSVGAAKWESDAEERLFWGMCADAQSRDPHTVCEFNKEGGLYARKSYNYSSDYSSGNYSLYGP